MENDNIKLKYTLRGFGIGMVVTAIVMFLVLGAMGFGKNNDSDSDNSSSQNKELNTDINSGDNDTTEIVTTSEEVTEIKEENKTEEVANASTDEVSEAPTEEVTETITDEVTEAPSEEVTEATTEAPTEVTTEATTEATTSDVVSDGNKCTIKVKSGMWSTEICKKLKEGGIIDDYEDFDNWLDRKGYSTKILIGTYTFEKGMTYEQIANILMGR